MRHFEMDKLKAQGGSVGQSKYHESAIKQVCGNANYADDNPEPHGCLHAYPVLAPITSGFIKSIDTSKALEVAGVPEGVWRPEPTHRGGARTNRRTR